MTSNKLTLISHHLCPFVQRAAIALLEQEVGFERINIDLSDKPGWFRKLSPRGKVPVLVVNDETVLFESSVIAQYVDEISGGHLLSNDLLQKARERSWMEFASSVIGSIGNLYNAADETTFEQARSALTDQMRLLDDNTSGQEWFAGADFSLVDAAFAPVFRYFDVIEPLTGIRFLNDTANVQRWRISLSARQSVQEAVAEDYELRLLQFLAKRDSVIGRLAAETVSVRQQVA